MTEKKKAVEKNTALLAAWQQASIDLKAGPEICLHCAVSVIEGVIAFYAKCGADALEGIDAISDDMRDNLKKRFERRTH